MILKAPHLITEVLIDISRHNRSFSNRRTLQEVVAEMLRVSSLACRCDVEFGNDGEIDKFRLPKGAKCLTLDPSELIFGDNRGSW